MFFSKVQNSLFYFKALEHFRKLAGKSIKCCMPAFKKLAILPAYGRPVIKAELPGKAACNILKA
jgi:hypothetical protein